MSKMRHFIASIVFGFLCFVSTTAAGDGFPVLNYHRFGPKVADSMTVKTSVFESQMQWLVDNGYTVIPLSTLVAYLRGKGPPPPEKSVVITADDGHKSVYSEMLPVVKRYDVPVTLFIYPSAISNASYALTWEQLRSLKDTGLFDIQSHTLWSPNFKKEKRKLEPNAYSTFVQNQLKKSKSILEKRMETKVDLLAWPFGIYDEYLEQAAEEAGYVCAFSIDRRHAGPDEDIMSQPRYLMVNADGIKGFAAIMTGRAAAKKK